MRTIEIVTHCWRYSRTLRYQLSSLFNHPPEKVAVAISICFSEDDKPTRKVLDEFLFGYKGSPNVTIDPHPMCLPELLNRSIGRNLLALKSRADLIWFTDADYCFGEGCLDALVDVPIHPDQPGYSLLYYPRKAMFTKDHATGDAYSDMVAGKTGLVGIDPADFIDKPHKLAFGGIQIVPRCVANQVGYVNSDPRQMRPVTDGRWIDTKGDIYMRKILSTKGKPIDIPNCFRIRQTVQGEVDTRKV